MAQLCARFGISPRQLDDVTLEEHQALVDLMQREAKARKRANRQGRRR